MSSWICDLRFRHGPHYLGPDTELLPTRTGFRASTRDCQDCTDMSLLAVAVLRGIKLFLLGTG